MVSLLLLLSSYLHSIGNYLAIYLAAGIWICNSMVLRDSSKRTLLVQEVLQDNPKQYLPTILLVFEPLLQHTKLTPIRECRSMFAAIAHAAICMYESII